MMISVKSAFILQLQEKINTIFITNCTFIPREMTFSMVNEYKQTDEYWHWIYINYEH